MELYREENLSLVQLNEDHAEELFSLVNDNREYLREWLPWLDTNTTLNDTEEFIQFTLNSYERSQCIHMAIFYNDKLVGLIGQHEISWMHKYTSIGYWLDKDSNGNGIMQRSLKAIIDYSFNEQELNLITLAAAVENKKSRSVAEKLNFKFEGIARQREWLYDHYVDHAMYSLLKSEYLV